ncbi:MAG: hypothetical protein L0Z50_25880 [Verrucomicrobiales bacterium]|nr:hypothetical protein [Verrucomicrobiales bacterium]
MLLLRSAAAAFAITHLAVPVLAQDSPRRDPEAVTVLNRAIAIAGWASPPADAVAKGSVSRNGDERLEAFAFEFRGKGLSQYRIAVQDELATTTVSDGVGAAVIGARGTHRLQPHSTMLNRPWILPFYSMLSQAMHPETDIQYLGVDDSTGEPAHRLEVTFAAGGNVSLVSALGALKVWISVASELPIQVQYARVADDNPSAWRIRTRGLSDYRAVCGMAVPFRQEESADGAKLFSLQLSEVRCNVGLSDSEFTLPAAMVEEPNGVQPR